MSHFERIKLGVPADSWVLMTRGNLMNSSGLQGKVKTRGMSAESTEPGTHVGG